MIGGVVGIKLFPQRVTSLTRTADQQKIVSSQGELISNIAKTVGPSVVSINTKSTSTNSSLEMLFGDTPQISQSAGTGVIISSDGIVLTNKHVIDSNITSVSITTSDGKTYDNVEVLARDPRDSFDIAFLKIKSVSGLTPAKLGDSSKMQVGDAVVAIGNALGQFENTVTSGIISGKGRPVTASDGSSAESLTNLFQTDAAINSGNSGGPLVNMNSEVIGLNTAVASGAQNIGFSIPINDIKSQIASILEKGKLEVPYLGIRYILITPELKDQYKLNTEGAWLKGSTQDLAVINGSPADKAGLKEGDIIVKINGKTIDSNNPPSSVLNGLKVGDTAEITYVRDGKTSTVKAKLEVSPSTN
jgi:serine protease Do